MTKTLREGADSADRESSRTAATATGESFEEQIARVGLMSEGDPTWDLSDNDCAALHAVLCSHDELLACLRRMCGMYGAYSRRLAPLLAEDEGTIWTFERANSLALEAIAKAQSR